MEIDLESFDRGTFVVHVLAIIHKDGKILIGKRENDPYIKELTWGFPGGRPTYDKTLEESLKIEVKKKTNIEIKIKKLIFARIVPSAKQFLSLYYLCEPISDETVAGEKFTEVKWIKPTEVVKYFKPPADPFIIKFLEKQEKG